MIGINCWKIREKNTEKTALKLLWDEMLIKEKKCLRNDVEQQNKNEKITTKYFSGLFFSSDHALGHIT